MSDTTFALGLLASVLGITFTWARTYGVARLAARANIKTSFAMLILRDGAPLRVPCLRLAAYTYASRHVLSRCRDHNVGVRVQSVHIAASG